MNKETDLNYFTKVVENLKKIEDADAVLVINEDKGSIKHYVGGNTFLEMGFAFALDKPIFFKNPIPSMLYEDELQGMLPVILKDLKKITNYMKGKDL